MEIESFNKTAQFFLDSWIKNKIHYLIDCGETKWIWFTHDCCYYKELYCCDFDVVCKKLDYLGFEIKRHTFAGDLQFKFIDKIHVI